MGTYPQDLLDGGSATGKVKNALPGTMIDARKQAKSVPKKLDTCRFFLLFLPLKSKFHSLF